MTADLHLAIAHHLLFLSLAGVLAFEIGAIRSGMDREDVLRVARVDIWYGVLAGAIILVGFSRAIFAAKGWAYYSVNLFFWAKLGGFAVVGLLSIMPTVELIRWRKAISGNPTFSPAPHGIRNVRRVRFAEAILLASFLRSPPPWLVAVALVPIFAEFRASNLFKNCRRRCIRHELSTYPFCL